MSPRRKLQLALSFFLVVLVGLTIGSIMTDKASADVYPNSPFTYQGYGGTYQGSCTTDLNNGHFINTCHASLVSGTPVTSVTMLSGPNLRGVITPAGTVTEAVILS